MSDEYLRVVVRVMIGNRDTRRAFWACRWSRAGDRVTFVECDADGGNDARSVSNGNGGTVRLVIAGVSDVMSVRAAQMNFKYGELETVPACDAAVHADKFKQVTGRKWHGEYRRAR